MKPAVRSIRQTANHSAALAMDESTITSRVRQEQSYPVSNGDEEFAD